MTSVKANGESSRTKGEMSALSKAYLILYNGVQSVGWSYILYNAAKLILKRDISTMWDVCGPSLVIFQTLAVLEILHCIFRLVPSSALVTGLQVFSRVFQVWCIMMPVKEVQTSPSLAIALIAWGVTESIRYSYYGLNLMGISPKIMTWCRYTFFYVLYPAGVTGELGNIYYALNTIKTQNLFSISLPNRLNFSFNFYYSVIALVLSYVPLFPKLFLHMVHQRKKILGGISKNAAKKLS